jgi:hypothetical protein
MNTEQIDLERRFQICEELILADRALAAEFADSAPDFFHGHFDAERLATDDLARRRHLEWFLTERVSPNFETLAVVHLAEKYPEQSGLAEPAAIESFLNSHAGVFEVTSVDPGHGLWMRDLASQGEYPIVEPDASSLLQRGDLIAGRIFPIQDSLHHVSRAAAFLRNKTLLDALRTDLDRARNGRRGLLRVSQAEIEGMFFGADLGGAPRDPVGDLRSLLQSGGVEPEQIEEWLEELASTPFERSELAIGADEQLAPILDALAFETSVDLDAARRLMIHAWEKLWRTGLGQGASVQPSGSAAKSRVSTEGDPDIARVVADFEAKTRQGAPIEQLLSELEEKLALDLEPEGEDSPAPDFPGVVGAMIEEFLWETGLESGAARVAELDRVKSFGRFAKDIGVFENLSVRDLITYTCWWLPESGELENGSEARELLSALQQFCRWAEETHEVPLHTQFKSTITNLQSSLTRVIEANRRRTRSADKAEGELYEVLRVEAAGDRALVRDRAQNEVDVTLDPELGQWLRARDRLRARRHDDARLAVYCVYPPEAAAISEH